MKEKEPWKIERSPVEDKVIRNSTTLNSKHLRSVTAPSSTIAINSEFVSQQGQIGRKLSPFQKLSLTKSFNRGLATTFTNTRQASGTITVPSSPSFLNETAMLKIHTKFSEKNSSFMGSGNNKNSNRRIFIRSSSVPSSHCTQNNINTLNTHENISEMSALLLNMEDNDFTPYSSHESIAFSEETCSTPPSPAFPNNTVLKRAYDNINQMKKSVSKLFGKRYSEKEYDVDESAKEKYSLTQVPEISCQSWGSFQSVCGTADPEADDCVFYDEEPAVERLQVRSFTQGMFKHERPNKSLSAALDPMRPKQTASQVFEAKKLHDRKLQVNSNNSFGRIKSACELHSSISVPLIQFQRKAKSSISDRFQGIRNLDDATRKMLEVDIIEPLNIDELITKRQVHDGRHYRLY